MGADKFQAQLLTFGVSMDIEECRRIISVYRETYPKIPELWKKAGRMLNAMMRGAAATFGADDILQVEGRDGIRLPNGLYIKYPKLRKVRNEDGTEELVYNTKKGRAVIPNRIYGGKVVENVCQALARIIIGEQMLKIARKLRVVMTVHDAVGSLAPTEEADKARDYVEACMRIRPKWAPALPLNCESKMGASYGG
jgi:DNA polymerase